VTKRGGKERKSVASIEKKRVRGLTTTGGEKVSREKIACLREKKGKGEHTRLEERERSRRLYRTGEEEREGKSLLKKVVENDRSNAVFSPDVDGKGERRESFAREGRYPEEGEESFSLTQGEKGRTSYPEGAQKKEVALSATAVKGKKGGTWKKGCLDREGKRDKPFPPISKKKKKKREAKYSSKGENAKGNQL